MLLARASTSPCWSILFRAYKLATLMQCKEKNFKCSFIPQMMGLDLFSPRLFNLLHLTCSM